jgi:ribosome-associated protein
MILVIMAKKRPEGYWVRGLFVVRGSELDRELNDSDTLSKTDLKKQSADVQALGEDLLTLRGDLYAKLDLPEKLRDAVNEAKRITSFEGKRRQMQYIGKLMRLVDPEPIRTALDAQSNGTVEEKITLHQTEYWRDQLIASDAKVTAFLNEFPQTDVQHLRALVRQARKDMATPAPAEDAEQGTSSPSTIAANASAAQRSNKNLREIFQLVKRSLQESKAASAAHEDTVTEARHA